MSASAALPFARRILASCGLAAGGAVLSLALVPQEAHAQSNPCAIFGAGFVPLNGSNTCVRIGGRVRVDAAVVPTQNIYGSSDRLNFAPSAEVPLDAADRAHLRLQGGNSSGMPRTR